MIDAPERIWADPPSLFDGVDLWHTKPEGAEIGATEYISLDAHEAAVAAARKEGIALRNFVEDFAAAKIDALRHQPAYGESPEDEPDPVVEAETVWAWQADAKDALSEASK